MRVLWFNRRSTERGDNTSRTICAARERTADEVSLALRLIPLYRVLLQVDDPRAPARDWWPLSWRATLTALVGAERTQRILSEARATGVAIIATCPHELAEHYRNELVRYALPCVIAPA